MLERATQKTINLNNYQEDSILSGQSNLTVSYGLDRMDTLERVSGTNSIEAGMSARVQQSFAEKFKALASDKSGFHSLMKNVYGGDYDVAVAEKLRQQSLKGDASWLPPVQFLDDQSLQGAYGAYNSKRNVVYINERYLNHPEMASRIYLEEAGAALDTRLKKCDTRGDEGELFRLLMSGQSVNSAELARIRAENDAGVIFVNGEAASVEFWNPFKDIEKAVKHVGKQIENGVKHVSREIEKGVKHAGKEIEKAAKHVGKQLQPLGDRIFDGASGIFEGVISEVMYTLQSSWNGVQALVRGLGKLLRGETKEGTQELEDGIRTLGRIPLDQIMLREGKMISAIQTLFGAEPVSQRLSSKEIAELRKVYGDSLDYGKIRIKQGNAGLFTAFGSSRPFVHGNTIYFPNKDYTMDLLVHEAAHVWQFQNGGPDYMADALYAQNAGGDGYKWYRAVDARKPWEKLDPESQGEILRDAYVSGYFKTGKFLFRNPETGVIRDYTIYMNDAVRKLRAGKGA